MNFAKPSVCVVSIACVFGVFALLEKPPYLKAEEPEPVALTPEVVINEALPEVSARAYGVFDIQTGELISAHNAEVSLPIASVTKLVAAAASLEVVPLETPVVIAESDVVALGRAGRLSAGEVYSIHDLLFPLLLESSNDSAAALERVTEGAVITKMNELATTAGTEDTHFTDASGLSDQNQASVADLALLTATLYREAPHVFDISRLANRVAEAALWVNTSPLLAPSYRGGKHGYTEAAGRTAVALFEEEIGSGNTGRVLGYIVLGSSDLSADIATLRTFVATHAELE